MDPRRPPHFAGAVLTGGASRRMGADKALMELGGRPLAAVAAAALRGAGAEPVRAVGGDLGALSARGLAAIADLHPGEGPLGGLLTALRWTPHDVVAVLACDLPAIGPEEVAAIVAALLDDPSALVAAPTVDGRSQLLTAAYRRAALPALQAAFDRGERAVRRAVAGAGLTVVTAGPLDAARLADADTPADLARFTGPGAVAPFTAPGADSATAEPPPVRGAAGHEPMSEPPTVRGAAAKGAGPGRVTSAAVDERPAVPEVDVHTAAERQAGRSGPAGGATLLDVREPDEYEEVRAEGAVLMPLGDVADRADALPRDRPLLMICRSGARSLRAAEFLAERGFDVANVAGGTLAWLEAGLPVEHGR